MPLRFHEKHHKSKRFFSQDLHFYKPIKFQNSEKECFVGVDCPIDRVYITVFIKRYQIEMTTPARYRMHKYWGKKPSHPLRSLIQNYSHPFEILLDPFAGSGVFACEAYLASRSVIANDINPAAHFIQSQLLEEDVSVSHERTILSQLQAGLQDVRKKWYGITCPRCGRKAEILSTLRDQNDQPLKNSIACTCSKTRFTAPLTRSEQSSLREKEKELVPNHPHRPLITNARISARPGMSTDSVFTKRALNCHIALHKAIQDTGSSPLLLAFTANLANCSRLVPPIRSRGEFSQGAWMTGFYTGEQYIENNVFHYFENRVRKVLNGKKDYLQNLPQTKGLGRKFKFDDLPKNSAAYILDQYDAKALPYPDESIDYIFTDPPYGDSVPYLEQSILWNTWLEKTPPLDREIVISDS
ncbi:MAG: DNA methyltransferase, partial [Myxococcota bacterium]|nr:DNA methyltransferase [Myxococcota bacterium]